MASAKKNRSSLFPVWLGKLLAHFWGPGRPVAAVLLLVAGLSCGTVVAWHQVRGRLLASGQYTVTLDKVAITPPPNWIHADIREVFRDASLDGPLGILDDNLPERVAHAFSLHPWVAKVGLVRRLRRHGWR